MTALVIWKTVLDTDTLKPLYEPMTVEYDPEAVANLAEGFCPLPDYHPEAKGSHLLVTPDGWAYCPVRFPGDPYDAWRLE